MYFAENNFMDGHYKFLFLLQSGLMQACKNSQISLCTAEKELLKFLKSYVPERKCPIAGNSVYMDRLFIMKYMPSVHEYLHYRIIDTSTIKELCR